MAFIQNVDFITRINTYVREMMKDGKIDKNDIPKMVLLVTYLISLSGKSNVAVTDEQLSNSISALYDYIMGHYNLFPADEVQKAEFKAIFDVCVQLALFQPNISKTIKSVISCRFWKRPTK